MSEGTHCKVCGGATTRVGTKRGSYRPQEFEFRRCPACGYAFVSNPWVDYAEIYSEAYYQGQGADPLVDYAFELENPQATVRQYEWRGILAAVRALVPVSKDTRWLDFGCGNGGLVRHCRTEVGCQAFGFEDGWIRGCGAAVGIPYLDQTELDAAPGSFDVVTAIEVLEHVPDPIEFLRRVRSLLRPNGLLFLTTGNAEPHRADLLAWPYTMPEIHVSFFEPRTLEVALAAAGFRPERRPALPGFTDIIRFKILKNLRVRRRRLVERVLPWGTLARLADARHQVSAHPVGWAA